MTPLSAPSLSLPPNLTRGQLEDYRDAVDAGLARESLARFAVRLNPLLDLKPFHHYVIERLEAVERGDIRNLIISIPPRHGKPLDVETPVQSSNGSYTRLGDIQVGDRVITGKGRVGTISAVHEQGVLPVVKITTHGGRSVRAALDHPFLTPNGWVKAGDLKVDDALGCISRPWTLPSTESYVAEEFRLAGYFIGDGNVTRTRTGFNARITNIDPEILADIHRCAEHLGFGATTKTYPNRAATVHLRDGVRPWLQERGLAGHNSHTKRVPSWVFEAHDDMIANFLAGYFSCDGCVSGKGFVKGRRDVAVELYSIQRPLLEDAQHLLLRLGIQSRLRLKVITYKGEPRDSYCLTLTSTDEVAKFRERIPVVGAKAERLRVAEAHRAQFEGPLLPDRIVSVEPDGESECRCLTLSEGDDPTFTANDLVVHNTELVSVNLPPWILGRDPRAQIILASYGLDLARQNSRTARNKLYEPAWPFPDVELATDSASVERWGTTRGGSVLASGVGSRITGFGAHYLIIDDPFEGREAADSERARDRVWNWYRGDAITRRMPKGRTIILATRWHEDDLTGRILNQDGAANDWVVINLPAVAGADDPIGREPGQALDPDRYPIAELRKIETDVGSRNWSSLYQGSPTADGGDLIKTEWWQLYDYQDLAKKGLKPGCIVVDPAYGGGSNNDYSVALVGGIHQGRFYVIDIWRQKATYVQLRQALGDLYRKWRVPVVIEDVGPGRILLQELRSGASAREDHVAIPTIPFKLPAASTSTGGRLLSKRQRVESITSFIEGGLVFLPDDAKWLRSFQEECADFPGGAHDDQVDALVMFLLRSASVRQEIRDMFMAPQSYSWMMT